MTDIGEVSINDIVAYAENWLMQTEDGVPDREIRIQVLSRKIVRELIEEVESLRAKN